jgi:hypothetical protein
MLIVGGFLNCNSSVISPEPHYFDTITSKLIEESKSISTDVS